MPTKMILEFEKPILELENKIDEMKALSSEFDIQAEIDSLESKVEELKIHIYKNLTRWQRVQIARHPERPQTDDYIKNIFTDFYELHGDRRAGDDHAIVGGTAFIDNIPIMLVGHQKGKDTKSNVYRNFGMPNPEGYRKAERLFHLAEKFKRPVICFIDTPGAYPGIEAEERGQAEAIARNLFVMSELRTPIIVVIIGEGASGGAIGIGVGDKVFMLENSWYSVISPESCSSILWRSWDFKEQAAEALRLTAKDLKEFAIIDDIIPEPVGGAHRNHPEMFATIKNFLLCHIYDLQNTPIDELVKNRRKKFYDMGVWTEENV